MPIAYRLSEAYKIPLFYLAFVGAPFMWIRILLWYWRLGNLDRDPKKMKKATARSVEVELEERARKKKKAAARSVDAELEEREPNIKLFTASSLADEL
ncbi:hypothetical protein BJ875DRAFT_479605 [Amylocarpus encephaloides]|uniref:Uncharacterized protein n=1 Tax=Amylocarpus encephaloides TaxID=45428 RepID=A0A9P7YTS8_9HELO|nr:hypothetical protein BJ875DRAFT_479605 [Amylocarpus encephaloides]